MTRFQRPRRELAPGWRGCLTLALGLVGTLLIGSAPVSAGEAARSSKAQVRLRRTVDSTCRSNAAPALDRWLRGLPAHRTVVFPRTSCLLLAGPRGIDLSRRSDLTLVGRGTRIRLRTDGDTNASSAFFLQDSVGITVRGFRVDGGNSSTGTVAAEAAIDEHLNGAVIRAGSERVTFARMRWDRLRGFGVMITDDGRPGHWPAHVTIRDSVIRGGEMGVAITAGRDILIARNEIVDTVYIAIDLEPDRVEHGFERVRIIDNVIRRYGWGRSLTSWFVAANPADAVVDEVPMVDLRIIGNVIRRGPARQDNGNADGLGGLGIRADKSNLKRGVVIRDNVSFDDDVQSSGRSVLYLANVRDLTVVGNRQPIRGRASLLSDRDTSGIRLVRGNKTGS